MGRCVLSDFIWNRFLFLLQTEVKVRRQTLVTLQQSGVSSVTTHLAQFLFPARISSDFPLLTYHCGNSAIPLPEPAHQPAAPPQGCQAHTSLFEILGLLYFHYSKFFFI